jgi:hypothetical protein
MKINKLAELPPDERQELLTRFLPPKSKDKSEQGFAAFIPIEADGPEECLTLLKLHVAACLAKKAERPTCEVLQDPKTHAGLLRAVGMIGTHNPKAPNANVAALPLLACDPGWAEDIPLGASSRTTSCFRRTGSAGNAADAAYMAFLAKEFEIEGQSRSVGADFARRGPLWQAAIGEGLPQTVADELADRLNTRFDGPTDEPIDRFLKQIYWPTEDGSYCLISPVQSFGILGETVLRIDDAVRKHQHVVPRESTKVAGANPINAGQLNAEIAGLHPHLLCLPPQRDSRRRGDDWTAALLAQLAAGNLFHPGLLAKDSAATLKSTFDDPRENAEAKHRFTRNLAHAVREALQEAEELAEALQAQDPCPLLEERFANVPAELKAWLDPSSLNLPETAPLSKDLLALLAGHIYEKVFAKHALVGGKDLIGAGLRGEIIKAIEEAL